MTAWRVATGAVVLAAEKHHHDDDEDEDGGADPEDLDPPGWAGEPVRRSRIGPGGRKVFHAALLVGGSGRPTPPQVTIQSVAVNAQCPFIANPYTPRVPRLWNDTIEAHRHQVRDAILDTTAALAAERGLTSVTMSEIAEQAGIGRATLYKYFPSVDAILHAWHDRQIAGHLQHLADVRDGAGDAGERLEAVLEAYALIHHGARRHDDEPHRQELAAFLHGDEHVRQRQQHLHRMIRDLVAEAAAAGHVRDDVTPGELATYCLHALQAASTLPSRAAVQRLVAVVLRGLRSPT